MGKVSIGTPEYLVVRIVPKCTRHRPIASCATVLQVELHVRKPLRVLEALVAGGRAAAEAAALELANGVEIRMNGPNDKRTGKDCLKGQLNLLAELLQVRLAYCRRSPAGVRWV